MNTIAICDYGMGNLHSVASAITQVAPDADVHITADAELIERATRVIFPGVGAVRDCMSEIQRLGFDTIVKRAIASGKPVLGICVGMQLLFSNSEENGGIDCMGIVDGVVKYFGDDLVDAQGEKLKVPHMGWNNVRQSVAHPLWESINDQAQFYFVHSYYCQPKNSDLSSGVSEYGSEFTSAIAKDNLFATQFHPEKSHRDGLQLLANFCRWTGE
ncbi:imidazole glycerol phosphate synthase subunit HisH [Sessilibacter corallicola]|uniref:imidazole glycerol phosphate synthase subunit HisH n=1 Tax=Sessilibacter corallicola TaxID=2904075 RepID=UPI003312FA3E